MRITICFFLVLYTIVSCVPQTKNEKRIVGNVYISEDMNSYIKGFRIDEIKADSVYIRYAFDKELFLGISMFKVNKNVNIRIFPNKNGYDSNGNILFGHTQGLDISIFKRAFNTYSDLISTLYHESIHVYNTVFNRGSWVRNLTKRDNIDEYLAYKAEYD